MSEPTWLVLRCHHCGQCSGHRFQKGRCPHCGQSITRETELVKQVPSSADLHIEVALANTPEALRDELKSRLVAQNLNTSENETPSARRVFQSLRDLANITGTLSRNDVESMLKKKGLDMPVEAVMEQAENEGLVLRTADGHWMFLE